MVIVWYIAFDLRYLWGVNDFEICKGCGITELGRIKISLKDVQIPISNYYHYVWQGRD